MNRGRGPFLCALPIFRETPSGGAVFISPVGTSASRDLGRLFLGKSQRRITAISNRGGLTLTELLITIAIIGMLMALLLPAINSAAKRPAKVCVKTTSVRSPWRT